MSIKLALLKSGEEVIADIKEIVSEDEKVVSFLLIPTSITEETFGLA